MEFAAALSPQAHLSPFSSARPFSLNLSFPGILAEVDNTHSPERSEAAFTFITFKVLGTLETPWRALAGAVLCPADAGKEEHGSGLGF